MSGHQVRACAPIYTRVYKLKCAGFSVSLFVSVFSLRQGIFNMHCSVLYLEFYKYTLKLEKDIGGAINHIPLHYFAYDRSY